MRLTELLYADDLVLCGELEQNRKVVVANFVEVCRKSGLKINADKNKEVLECEIHGDGTRMIGKSVMSSNI